MEKVLIDKKDIKCLQHGDLLIRWCNIIASFYGHPVYLVGSQLYKHDPRDVDLVCIIPNDEFVLRYINQKKVIGDTDKEKCDQWGLRWKTGLYNESNWEWARDVSHKALQGMDYTRQQIDFKVLPLSFHQDNHNDHPIMKICESPYKELIESK